MEGLPGGNGGDRELTGEVATVVFRNANSGFGVVELSAPGGPGRPRAAGPLSGLVVGQPVRLHGRWEEHPRYGPTFAAVSYELTAPRTTGALVSYLSSDRFPGVGAATAERIVRAFGLRIAEVIADDPEAIVTLEGVTRRQAEAVVQAWRQADVLSQLVARLSAAGVPAAAVAQLHRRHGDDVTAVLDADPYVLLDVAGVTWQTVDAYAAARGIDRLDERRLAAAVAAALGMQVQQGHTCADTATLLASSGALTGATREEMGRGLEQARRHGRVVREVLAGTPVWSLPRIRQTEQALAAALARLLRGRPSPVGPSDADADGTDAALTGRQRAAVAAAVRAPVSVLTGGPGTGKTRTVQALVAACAGADLNVALCAPTGRAAKRMEELTGHPATTVHRLLEAQPTTAGRDDGTGGDGPEETTFRFSYGPDRRLPHDVVIVDEFSMADTELAGALTAAVDDDCRVVLVGDGHQLPSVGPGAVLRDVLALGDDLVPRQHLDHVHRQAARSRIVTLAHEIRAGTAAPPRGRQGDVYAVSQRAAGLAERVAEIVAVRAPDFFGIAPSDVQVLAPVYRGPAGVDRLNAVLAERLNPARGRPAVAGLREGDRVVQTRNDAELDIANGEVGEVTAVAAADGRLEVAFAAGTTRFSARAARHLRPAWCLTVHKSQGGEWPVVVLAVDPSHGSMLYRELVYTAVTRARTGLIIVGQPGLVAAAARRAGPGLHSRRTALVQRVAGAVSGAAEALP